MRDAIQERWGGDVVVSIEGDLLILEFDLAMYEKATITFADLQWLSQLLGTTNINFEYEAGWGGSDVTGGDPDEVRIVVRGWK